MPKPLRSMMIIIGESACSVVAGREALESSIGLRTSLARVYIDSVKQHGRSATIILAGQRV
jgi:hypothetical protein